MGYKKGLIYSPEGSKTELWGTDLKLSVMNWENEIEEVQVMGLLEPGDNRWLQSGSKAHWEEELRRYLAVLFDIKQIAQINTWIFFLSF